MQPINRFANNINDSHILHIYSKQKGQKTLALTRNFSNADDSDDDNDGVADANDEDDDGDGVPDDEDEDRDTDGDGTPDIGKFF